jgi:hypothetical protein
MSEETGLSDNEAATETSIGAQADTVEGAKRGDLSASELLLREDSDETPGLTVIMPTLNEEEGIAECIERIKTAAVEMQVTTEILISDSSTDRTPEIAREMGAIVVEPDVGGYGSAYKYAFERARGDYIAIGDADTTYDFEELPKLVRLATKDDVDMTMGSRLEGDIKPGAMPSLHQYVGNPLLTRFLNTFYDAGVSDAHSGMRVIEREALEELELKTTGMEFASEMIMDAAAKDMTIEERPITYHEREGEATLDSFQDGWRHVRFMLVNAPGYLFTAPAALFVLLGVVVMGLSLGGVQLGPVTFGLQTMVAGSLSTLVGYQVGALAIFSSVATNPIREPSDPITNLVRDRLSLERGAAMGLAALGLGLVMLSFGFIAWMLDGSASLPSPSVNLLAATITLLGVMTVFSSFFLGTIKRAKRAG